MAKISIIQNTIVEGALCESPINLDILREKQRSESRYNNRINNHTSYQQNTHLDQNTLPYLVYGLLGIVTSFFATSIYILIPVHDVVTNPEYWYEIMLQTSVILVVMGVFFVVNCSEWMNIDRIKTIKNAVIVSIVLVIVYITIWCLSYVVWTHGLDYQWPIPFVAYLVTYTAIFYGWIALFYCYPKAWRKDKLFNKRIKIFLVALSFNMGAGMAYQIILKGFIVLSDNYQWILVVIFPLIREFYLWLTLYFGKKACAGDIQRLIIIVTHYTNSRHATILSTIVGSYTPAASASVLFAVDIFMNLYACLSIVWNAKKNCNLEKQINLLQELAINELVEIIVPLTYLLCYLAAYYGPNAKVIGNIGNDYWQYEIEGDLTKVVVTIVVYFVVDLVCCIICTFILWIFCRISLLHVCASLCKEFGLVFALNMAIDFSCVS